MATKKDRAPHTEAIMTAKGLRAHTALDAELLASVPQGAVFELVPVSKRSNRQLRTYWKALGIAVRSTGKWPTPEHLHRDIKFTLGYRELVRNMKTGETSLVPDSVALDKMPHDKFVTYMNAAMELLADSIGYDPMAFLNEEGN